MATFLKVVSGVYLFVVWLVFVGALRTPAPPTIGSDLLFHLGVFLAAVCFSIPAVILFAFGQMVGELRSIRHYSRQQAEHLKAMRAYYEPHRG
uniref:DUF4282 domain-containing protein n=1 Tax=Bradyrhizobium ottawaense TaxID=931866 RepID=A0A2U8P0P9_9BRAD|nr:hypothetical protein CIT37_02230 [Bradyrhizobium ottawaense]